MNSASGIHRRRSRFRTQAVALGILVVASVIGNVSLSASRIKADAPALVSGSASPAGSPASHEPATDDDAKLVPALYSWDPDVTFVFYRHVTKWM